MSEMDYRVGLDRRVTIEGDVYYVPTLTVTGVDSVSGGDTYALRPGDARELAAALMDVAHRAEGLPWCGDDEC